MTSTVPSFMSATKKDAKLQLSYEKKSLNIMTWRGRRNNGGGEEMPYYVSAKSLKYLKLTVKIYNPPPKKNIYINIYN